jgi:protein SCO1/2
MQALYRYILFLTGLLLLAACGVPHQYNANLLEPPEPRSDFTLPDQHGQPFRLSEQEGITLLFFGYTNCPDFCPATMGDWKQVKQHLGDAADDVQFAMITIDPEHDTPEVLQAYLDRFDPSFIGLRPTREQLDELNREYWLGLGSHGGQDGAQHEDEHADHQDSDATDMIGHPTITYVIDAQQQLRMLFRPDMEPEAMADDIRALLRSLRSR